MVSFWRAGSLLLPLVLVVACNDAPSTLEESLEGRTFVLESSDGYTLVADTTASVSFDAGKMSFSAGCNGYSTGISFDDEVLVTRVWDATDIACETELAEQDHWFVAFFSDRPTVQIDGDRLTFATDEATLIFLDD